MNKNVLTLPLNQSSSYTHQYGVYSIQKHRQLVEPLCRNPDGYLAFREAKGGIIHWLYQVCSPAGLRLHPQRPLAAQLSELDIILPFAQQIRLADYMKVVAENLKGDYRKEQLFYLLSPWQGDTNSAGRLPPLGPLPLKPRPDSNHVRPTYYALEDVCRKRVLLS